MNEEARGPDDPVSGIENMRELWPYLPLETRIILGVLGAGWGLGTVALAMYFIVRMIQAVGGLF